MSAREYREHEEDSDQEPRKDDDMPRATSDDWGPPSGDDGQGPYDHRRDSDDQLAEEGAESPPEGTAEDWAEDHADDAVGGKAVVDQDNDQERDLSDDGPEADQGADVADDLSAEVDSTSEDGDSAVDIEREAFEGADSDLRDAEVDSQRVSEMRIPPDSTEQASAEVEDRGRENAGGKSESIEPDGAALANARVADARRDENNSVSSHEEHAFKRTDDQLPESAEDAGRNDPSAPPSEVELRAERADERPRPSDNAVGQGRSTDSGVGRSTSSDQIDTEVDEAASDSESARNGAEDAPVDQRQGHADASPKEVRPYEAHETSGLDLAGQEQKLRESDFELLGLLPGDHVNEVHNVELADGNAAYFKPAEGEARDVRSSIPDGEQHRREVATYELDKALGFDLVPATVFRTDASLGPGSLQAEAPGPEKDESAYDPKDQIKMAILDYVSGNTDRSPGNHLSHADGRPAAIDNGLTFPEDGSESIRSSWVANVLGRLTDPAILSQVRAIDRDGLGESLRRCGLRERAIDGALRRLDEVRQGSITGQAWDGGIGNKLAIPVRFTTSVR